MDDKFIAIMAQIQENLEKLQEVVDDCFGVHPEHITVFSVMKAEEVNKLLVAALEKAKK